MKFIKLRIVDGPNIDDKNWVVIMDEIVILVKPTS